MPTLVIANKLYSSWSLRPWLLMKQLGLAFDEIVIPLDLPTTTEVLEALARRQGSDPDRRRRDRVGDARDHGISRRRAWRARLAGRSKGPRHGASHIGRDACGLFGPALGPAR